MNFSARKSMLDLILEGMKWRPLQKISGNKVSIAFLAVMCTTFVTWAWQKKPAMFVLFPSLEQFNILSSECDYAKGKWVAETRRPFYSGSSCRRWLSRAWACRLTKRSDFSYESFRWQPQGCEMREFRRNEFLWRYVRPANIVSVIISLYWKGTNWWMHTLLFSYEQSFSVECFKSLFEFRMQNKTIALVGDSLGRQQFQSLMCMVTGGEMSQEVEDVGKYYGLVKAPGVFRPDGWAYRFPSTNTTILYYWSASLCELEPLNTSDPATHFALHLDRPVTFLKQYLPRFDVLVLNTGHHWNSDKFRGNHWEMHAGGQPIVDGKLADLMNAKNLTLYSIARWVDSQLLQHPHLKAFLRTISPRHFVNGEWSTGGSCDNTVPLASGGQVLQDGSSDQLAEAAVKGTRVKLLDITALSQLREEGHISKYTNRATKNVSDCLHWCLPGIPDVWNEILYAQI